MGLNNVDVIGIFVIVAAIVSVYVSGYFFGVKRTIDKIHSELPKKQVE